jgi:HNH endonuclease
VTHVELKQITDEATVKATFLALRDLLKNGSNSYDENVGFQGKNFEVKMFWQKKYGFWSVIVQNRTYNRLWIAFGTQDPSKPSKHRSFSITCEANIPKSGPNGRIAGAFYRSGKHVYLCHDGHVGGGRKGIGKKAFLDWYFEKHNDVSQADVSQEHPIVVGEVSSQQFLSSVEEFVFDVEQFKSEVKGTLNVDQQMERDAKNAENEGEFDARGVQRDRERTLREINLRRGQPKFRGKVLRAYYSKCAISGYDCADALEAAHIKPYWNEDSNHVQNGILLRCDLHTLFDLGKIGVDPRTFKVVVSEPLRATEYGKLVGKKIRLPAREAQWPSAEALSDHLRRSKLL